VIAKAFARIHGQNLVNFGVAPLLFCDQADHCKLAPSEVLRIEGLHAALRARRPIDVVNTTRDRRFHGGTISPTARSASCSPAGLSTTSASARHQAEPGHLYEA
jgi:aconitase A